MLRLITRQRHAAPASADRLRRTPVQGYCPWCRATIADMSRLQAHLRLLHPLSAEFDALQLRTGG
ncbi:MAG: hypothetical protein ACYDCQ_01770 [Dehalococcoidia bacterium]